MSERRRLEPEVFALPVERMREGYYTDAYFNFSKRVLETRDKHPRVLMQVFQKYESAVLGGMDEAIAALRLCSGRHVGSGDDRARGSTAGTSSRCGRSTTATTSRPGRRS